MKDVSCTKKFLMREREKERENYYIGGDRTSEIYNSHIIRN